MAIGGEDDPLAISMPTSTDGGGTTSVTQSEVVAGRYQIIR